MKTQLENIYNAASADLEKATGVNDIEEIIGKGLDFYKTLREDENGRYKSWEYCYKVFYDAHCSNNADDDYIDYLCLHLSFYLATFFLQR